ncbi:MAG: hypothetical protein J2P48_03055 [Alphaproteobacteria bacterium]|nr:hypothetical protein [Alphaproteobacteria bacterium]
MTKLPGRLVLLGVVKLGRMYIVLRRHRDPHVHSAEDLGPQRVIETVCEPAQPLMEANPEVDAVGNR